MLDRLNGNEFVRKYGWPTTLVIAGAFLAVYALVIDPFIVDPIVDRIPQGDSTAWILAPWIVIALLWWITIRGLRKKKG